MKIILGSASKRRQQLLKEWGFKFDVKIPDIDEKQFRSDDVQNLPLEISKAKSEHLKKQIREPAILVTCDTVVVHDGQLYEKPKAAEDARRMLSSYGDKPVEVICGVVVVNTATGKTFQGLDNSKVYFYKVPQTLIEEMILLGKIFDYAGAFHIDDPPIKPYIAFIEGEPETVMGLPKFLTQKLCKNLRKLTKFYAGYVRLRRLCNITEVYT